MKIKKIIFSFLLLIILLISFSLNCFAKVYTIDEILTNKTIGYVSDINDIQDNLKIYLDYLIENPSECSSFDNRYCGILTHYQNFLSNTENLDDTYNYYILNNLNTSTSFYIYHIKSDQPLYYYISGGNSGYKIDSGGSIYRFTFSGAFDSNTQKLLAWNFSSYDELTSLSMSISKDSVVYSDTDIKDEDGNVIFEKNMNTDPTPEESTEDQEKVDKNNFNNEIISGFKDFGDEFKNPLKDFFNQSKNGLSIIKTIMSSIPIDFVNYLFVPIGLLLLSGFIIRLL